MVEFQARARLAFDEFIHAKLLRAIALAVRHPYLTVLAVVASIGAAGGLVASGAVGYAPLPAVAVDRYLATVTMPRGTQFQVTDAAARYVAEAARNVDRKMGGNAIESVAVLIGGKKNPSKTS